MILQAYAVSIVSWNIQDLGRTKDDAEIQFIAEVIRDFDIIAIQEVVAVDPAGAQAVHNGIMRLVHLPIAHPQAYLSVMPISGRLIGLS